MKGGRGSKALWIIAILLGIMIIGGLILVAGFFEAVEEVTKAPEAEMSIISAEERYEDTYGLWPGEGKVFLYLQVRMVNNGKKEIDINPWYFNLETGASVLYTLYHDHVNALTKLPAGSTHTFWISFEIPENERGTVLHFKEIFLRENISATIPSYGKAPPRIEMNVGRAEEKAWFVWEGYPIFSSGDKIYLFLSVSVKNNGKSEISLNPLYFKLKTKSGATYTTLYSENMPSGLTSGASCTFGMYFEIPTNEIGESLSFGTYEKSISASIPTYK